MNFIRRMLKHKMGLSSIQQGQLRSCQCTQAQMQSDVFQEWVTQIHEAPMHMHRKVWEYCYIAQVLKERGMLASGRCGLGFAVGQEPLSALFASFGCEIVATDLSSEKARRGGWVETNQHADSLDVLNQRQICDPLLFKDRVKFRFVDMRDLPDDLGTYDFIWSSCSLEHLGNMTLGEQFIFDSLKYLKPGGVSVHTTEYNVESNSSTILEGPTVLFRKRDLQRIAVKLNREGYKVDLDFTKGNLPYDRMVDKTPYKHDFHLKLAIGEYIVTSFGLIVES